MFALSNLVVLCALIAEQPRYSVHVRELTAPEVAIGQRLTGFETVFDVVGALNAPADLAGMDLWIARPVKGGQPQLLPIDWAGLTQRGLTATNYQILAGDRLFVQARPAK